MSHLTKEEKGVDLGKVVVEVTINQRGNLKEDQVQSLDQIAEEEQSMTKSIIEEAVDHPVMKETETETGKEITIEEEIEIEKEKSAEIAREKEIEIETTTEEREETPATTTDKAAAMATIITLTTAVGARKTLPSRS